MNTSTCCEKCNCNVRSEEHRHAVPHCENPSCPCHTVKAPEQQEMEWEHGLHRLLDAQDAVFHHSHTRVPVFSFIRELLAIQKAQESERVRKLVEGMRRTQMQVVTFEGSVVDPSISYNQALKDVLTALSKDS